MSISGIEDKASPPPPPPIAAETETPVYEPHLFERTNGLSISGIEDKASNNILKQTAIILLLFIKRAPCLRLDFSPLALSSVGDFQRGALPDNQYFNVQCGRDHQQRFYETVTTTKNILKQQTAIILLLFIKRAPCLRLDFPPLALSSVGDFQQGALPDNQYFNILCSRRRRRDQSFHEYNAAAVETQHRYDEDDRDCINSLFKRAKKRGGAGVIILFILLITTTNSITACKSAVMDPTWERH
jgi:hypothetical protein